MDWGYMIRELDYEAQVERIMIYYHPLFVRMLDGGERWQRETPWIVMRLKYGPSPNKKIYKSLPSRFEAEAYAAARNDEERTKVHEIAEMRRLGPNTFKHWATEVTIVERRHGD